MTPTDIAVIAALILAIIIVVIAALIGTAIVAAGNRIGEAIDGMGGQQWRLNLHGLPELTAKHHDLHVAVHRLGSAAERANAIEQTHQETEVKRHEAERKERNPVQVETPKARKARLDRERRARKRATAPIQTSKRPLK